MEELYKTSEGEWYIKNENGKFALDLGMDLSDRYDGATIVLPSENVEIRKMGKVERELEQRKKSSEAYADGYVEAIEQIEQVLSRKGII